jgi:hypothetical protein
VREGGQGRGRLRPFPPPLLSSPMVMPEILEKRVTEPFKAGRCTILGSVALSRGALRKRHECAFRERQQRARFT